MNIISLEGTETPCNCWTFSDINIIWQHHPACTKRSIQKQLFLYSCSHEFDFEVLPYVVTQAFDELVVSLNRHCTIGP